MRPPLLAIALLAFLPGAAMEAATLKGVVFENELGGPPVANVEVAAVAGANPTVSDSLGRFTLSFPKKQPGEAIRVVVQKAGHEVVNEVQLEMPLPADPDARPLTILLTIQFRFDEAEKAHLAAIEASPDGFDAMFAYGLFSQTLNRHKNAFAAYDRCLELARARGSKAEIARTLNNLGALHLEQSRAEEARKAFEEALGIFEQCAKRNPERFSPDVTWTKKTLKALPEPVARPKADPAGPGARGGKGGESGGAEEGPARPNGP